MQETNFSPCLWKVLYLCTIFGSTEQLVTHHCRGSRGLRLRNAVLREYRGQSVKERPILIHLYLPLYSKDLG